jgi:lanosterol synthase
LRRAQRSDGSFEGSWAVCFTYGTWFGVSGLLAAGAGPEDPAIRRACAFLEHRQRSDGGWGEHGDSCRERRWIEARDAGMAQTAWALSTLVRARHRNERTTARATQLLVDRQEMDGSWAREPLVGVFNKTCLIDYENYRHYFPLWALGEWSA